MVQYEYDDVAVAIVVQSVGGDLRVKGREGARLLAEGDGLDIEHIAEGQPYIVRSGGDCRLIVPNNVDMVLQHVGGDAKLTDLGGTTEIKTIGGDLTLRNLHHLQIKSVGGDLRLKWVEGNVTVENVGGDATIREVGGSVWIARVGSDLYLRNVEQSCVAERVGSDLVLNIDFAPEREYRFNVGSDVLCRVLPHADARFVLPTDTAVTLDIQAEITESEDGQQQIIALGDGSATIHIEKAEEVRFVGEEEDYMINLGAQIEEELDARMSFLEEKLSQQLEGLDERIQAQAEHWVSQAERMAERAQQQAERAVEHVRRSMERRKSAPRKRGTTDLGRRSARGSIQWGHAAAPSSEPVSEQERLMILKMVQENKITIEEAERLLAALESQD
jgi:hypothetical protein